MAPRALHSSPPGSQLTPNQGTSRLESHSVNSPPSRGWKYTFFLVGLTHLLWLLALPPLSWAPLGWVALIPLLMLLVDKAELNRSDYLAIYLSAFLFWQLAFYWLYLPYWATGIGGALLCGYFAAYLPAVVAAGRWLVLRKAWPLECVAPPLLAGAEWLRSVVFSGLSMAELCHTQYRHPWVLQVVDLAGQFTLTFLMATFAAGGVHCLAPRKRERLRGVLLSSVTLAVTLGYGAWRLQTNQPAPGLKVLIVQEVIDNRFASSEARAESLFQEYEAGFARYCQLTANGLQQYPETQLIVWPESINIYDWLEHAEPLNPAEPDDRDWQRAEEMRQQLFRSLAQSWGRPALIGGGRHVRSGSTIVRFNSAVLLGPDGQNWVAYDKVHRVPFGEYIPGGKWARWLYNFSPLASGIEPGAGPVPMTVAGFTLSPNICFESVLPRVPRAQVAQLAAAGTPANGLVSLTNEGWFWGSTEHEQHLAAAVFRSVETRLPAAVAANWGISAMIDATGRIQGTIPKRKPGILFGELKTGNQRSLYLLVGDWPAFGCGALLIFASFRAMREPRREKASAPQAGL